VHRDIKPGNLLLDHRGRLAIARLRHRPARARGPADGDGPRCSAPPPTSPPSRPSVIRPPRRRTATPSRAWPSSCSRVAVPSRPRTSPPRPARTSRTSHRRDRAQPGPAAGRRLPSSPGDSARSPTTAGRPRASCSTASRRRSLRRPPPRRAEPRATRTRLAGGTAPPRRTSPLP
jgi:hypothetical protein